MESKRKRLQWNARVVVGVGRSGVRVVLVVCFVSLSEKKQLVHVCWSQQLISQFYWNITEPKFWLL